ncbi:MAG: NUDIX hydrolase [Myxococcota bacterium]|nr:NUDIX hydrolase [Myxococcota bacterium]
MLKVGWSLLGALFIYAKIAWWGLVMPRVRNHLVVAQAIVCGEDGILLAVRSDLRGWELSGGEVEEGETADAAVCREVWEETGLEVEVDRHVGDYEREGFRPHTARVFLCHPVGGQLKRNWETLDLRWFPRDALPETLFPWFREPLRDAFDENIGEPVSRHEVQGVDAVLEAIRIDLRMRVSQNRAA